MGSIYRLQQYADEGNEVTVAVLGAGYVGHGLVDLLERLPATRPGLVVNRTPQRGIAAFAAAGVAATDVVVSDDADVVRQAVGEGRPVVSTDPGLLPDVGVDLLMAATGAIDYGARVMLDCLDRGLDVISMNAEADATIGPVLHRAAVAAGCVYTIADGDQPGAMLRQLEFVDGMGMEVVAAVNCKRHLNRHQNPDDSRPFAERDNTSVHMTTAFGDGTKMQIENAVVANVSGLEPDRRGMHGVLTEVDRAHHDIAGALSRTGCIEYTLGGDFGAGVGVVARTSGSSVMEQALKLYKMGDGPDYFFFRPYHLVALETPGTIADVVLDRQPLGRHPARAVAEVVAVAKRDLQPGDELDGIGGFGCYGEVDTVDRADGLLPIGLSHHARVSRAVPMDEPVPLDAVELDETASVVRLWREGRRSRTADSRSGERPYLTP